MNSRDVPKPWNFTTLTGPTGWWVQIEYAGKPVGVLMPESPYLAKYIVIKRFTKDVIEDVACCRNIPAAIDTVLEISRIKQKNDS